MSSLHPAIATVPAALLLGAIGYFVGEQWLSSISDTLARASVQVVALDPSAATLQRVGVAAAVGGAAPLALGVRAGITRVSKQPATLGQWATSLLFILMGTQVGLGGALFNTARVTVPSALDASVQAGAVQLALSDLALGNWALAGAAGAAVIVLAVGITGAGLEASSAQLPSDT